MAYFITELYIYPVKSLGGISLKKAEITDRGFRHDRRWMLVDADHQFLTQREFPEMALLQVTLTHSGLEISHKKQPFPPLAVPFEPESDDLLQVTVWDDVCPALAVSREADDWFSEVLAQKCRLVFMPDNSQRPVESKYARNQEVTSFSDGYPFLLIGQASLDDLNSRLDEKLPINRFRPNLVFSGGTPFEEDTWQQFDIQTLSFFPVKPCGRCRVTTTNQETAETGKEPLKTLATYRRQGNKILFGMNLLHHGSGWVTTGDELQHIQLKTK